MPDEPVVKIEPGPAAVPVVGDPPVAPAVVAAPVVVPPVVEPKPDWRDARIAELTGKINSLRTAAAQIPPKAPTESDADFEARVEARASVRAQELAANAAWDQQCVSVFTAGKTLYEDFPAKLNAIKATVNAQDANEVVQYNEVLAAAIETGKAPELMYQLGNNPGEYQRLMKLSPVKRGMELALLATKIGEAPEPSLAPKPITPIDSRGAQHTDAAPDDTARYKAIPKADWFARRDKQAAERGIQ